MYIIYITSPEGFFLLVPTRDETSHTSAPHLSKCRGESAKLWDAALKSENPPFNKGDIVYVASGLNGNIDNGIENPFVHVRVL